MPVNSCGIKYFYGSYNHARVICDLASLQPHENSLNRLPNPQCAKLRHIQNDTITVLQFEIVINLSNFSKGYLQVKSFSSTGMSVGYVMIVNL